MLSGIVPFDVKNDKEIIRKVRWGEYNLDIVELRNISSDAKDLIKQLLCYDPKNRFSAEEALRHPWIVRYDIITDFD